jgi:hypothetical protein
MSKLIVVTFICLMLGIFWHPAFMLAALAGAVVAGVISAFEYLLGA